MAQNLQYFLIPFLQPEMMLLIWIGVFAGIWVGAIPGLSVTMAASLLISFTFSWDINSALALICGVFVGGVYGGAITAILINIPGAPAAIATAMDGYPLAQMGEAGKAIGLCTTVSVFASFVGIVVLAVAAPVIANFSLKFAPRDFFLLAVMGLLLIGSIGGGDPIKGITAGAVGVLLSMVGMDPSTGELRYTFGNLYLMAGISFVTAMIGLFGVSEALTQFRSSGTKSPKQNLDRIIPSWETVPYARTSLRSCYRRTRYPPRSRVPAPSTMTIPCQMGRSENAGANRATRYTPALTIAAACRYAETGVGAAIAPGSQKWNGSSADLVAAPTRTHTIATVTAVPAGGFATTSERRNVPAAVPRTTIPPSIDSPPNVVTTIACIAARRDALRSA